MKRGLLLEGGGAKGSYQAGAIKALNERRFSFDCVGGTSIGAINAAFYVSNNFNGLYNLWLNTDCEELFGIDSKVLDNFDTGSFTKEDFKKGFKTINEIIANKGIDIKNIRKVLTNNINEKKYRKSKIDFVMNTYSISDLKPVMLFKNQIPEGKLIEYLISSSYLPCFKMEKIINDKYYIDGGVYTNCPIDMLMDGSYDELYIIRAWRTKLSYKKNKKTKVHIICPRENLGSIMLFNPRKSKYRMNLGYYDTLKYLDKLDGDKYYFKNYSEKYYTDLFDKQDYKQIIKKYNFGINPKKNKDFILKTLETICKENNINRFNVYNMPLLVAKLKYKLAGKKDNYYYDFIKKIKVDFD